MILPVLLAASAALAPAQDALWPSFRGPAGNGVVAAHPLRWNDEENLAWKVEIPGGGWSSPVVVEDRVFVTTAVQPDKEGGGRPLGFMGGVVSKHSARENARFIARLYGLDPDYVEAFSRWLTGIAEYFDQPVGTYSSGMRARFTFSLLLALEFDIYLIDEGMPNSTDVEFNRKAGDILRERLRTTTVVITHNASIRKMAHRVIRFQDGKIGEVAVNETRIDPKDIEW